MFQGKGGKGKRKKLKKKKKKGRNMLAFRAVWMDLLKGRSASGISSVHMVQNQESSEGVEGGALDCTQGDYPLVPSKLP